MHGLLLFILLIGAVIFSGSNNELRKRLQYFVFDSYNKIYQRPATDKVVIVDLDENSLRQIGQWPWSRDVMALLILNLKEMGAKVVGFDIVFAEEDRTSPRKIIQKLPNDENYQSTRDLIESLPDNDMVFSNAIKDVGNIVTGFTAAKLNETRNIPQQPISPTYLIKDKNFLLEEAYSTMGVATNLPIFSKNAAGNGHFMVRPETDGIIRRVPLLARYNPPQFEKGSDMLYPLLSLEALRVSIDPKSRMIIRDGKDKKIFDLAYQIKIGEFEIPIDGDSQFWVHYRDIKQDEYVPAHLILSNDEQAKSRIKDKIVFVGTSAEGLRDIRSTPLEQFVAGVEVHVNILEQIIQGRFLKRPSFISGAEAVVIAIAGLAIVALVPFINLIWLSITTFMLIGSMFLGSWISYKNLGVLLDPVYPSIVLFLLFVSSSLLSYLRSEADRRQVKTAFGHYISPVFMEELAKNPEKLKLGGEEKELSVMFTDIRNFTKISESLAPQELTQLMNDFLTPMSDLVMQSRGTIDKYMGDAMMAFWNAPLDDPDHARQACLTALKMNNALMPINQNLKKRAQEQGGEIHHLSAGIGINTGLCSVGNMGSQQRFAYSALGDTVNLASRLEGQTKTYGVEILIGEDTYKKVSDLAFLELDLIQVKGREKAVRVYTLMGDSDLAKNKEFKKWQSAHNGMLAAYRIADFDCAAQDGKEAKELAEGRLAFYYDLYMERIIEHIKHPPPDEWDGVYIARSK